MTVIMLNSFVIWLFLHLKYINKHVLSVSLGQVLWKPDAETQRVCEGNLVAGTLGISAYERVREAGLLNCDAQSPQLESLEWPRISEWRKATLADISQPLDMNCPCQWDINLDEAGPLTQAESQLWEVSGQLSQQPVERVPRAWRGIWVTFHSTHPTSCYGVFFLR